LYLYSILIGKLLAVRVLETKGRDHNIIIDHRHEERRRHAGELAESAPAALSAQQPAPSARHPTPSTQHPAPGTQHPAPGTWHPALAPFSTHPTPCRHGGTCV